MSVALRRIVKHYEEYYDPLDDIRAGGRRAKRAGCYTKDDFVKVCLWKSMRQKRRYASNPPARVRRITERAFSTDFEKARMSRLLELDGVGIPVASALLAAYDPSEYPVIDIRVWQALFQLGAVSGRPEGRGFTVKDWVHYLFKLRALARKLNVAVRRLEVSLFWFHADYLQGRKNLYDPKRSISRGLTARQREKLSWLVEG